MTVVPCRVCRAPVSAAANACPACGHPIPRMSLLANVAVVSSALGLALWLPLAALGLVLGVLASLQIGTQPARYTNRSAAVAAVLAGLIGSVLWGLQLHEAGVF